MGSYRNIIRPMRISLLAALGVVPAAACGSTVTKTGEPGVGAAGEGGTCEPPSWEPPAACGSVADPPRTAVCEGANWVPDADGCSSGFAECPDGTVHRVEPVACSPRLSVTACDPMQVAETASSDCRADCDCTEQPYGKCALFPDNFDAQCGCTYSCRTDADCGGGDVCVCDGVLGNIGARCMSASCADASACPSGECALARVPLCRWEEPRYELACRSDSDACRLDSDCPVGSACAIDEGVFTCLPTPDEEECVSGRPLRIDDEVRTASPTDRDDWRLATIAPDVAGPSPVVRAALARHWERIAALEHASVASFARFTLQLLALGAPAELVAAAQRAGAEEIDHAAIAYALASAYAGRAIGPGPLDGCTAPVPTDFDAVLAGVVADGCVGETLGSVEAAVLAATVRDPVLCEALTRVSEEERRHAELAWRTLQWLCDVAGTRQRARVSELFDQAIVTAKRGLAARAVVAPDWGLLSAAELEAIRSAALEEVVVPCMDALLGLAIGVAQPNCSSGSSTARGSGATRCQRVPSKR